ncbi:MAG: hypothetical protein ACYC0T_17165 [Ramlibacter sp.]
MGETTTRLEAFRRQTRAWLARAIVRQELFGDAAVQMDRVAASSSY